MNILMRDPMRRMALRNSLVHWRYSVATMMIVGIGLLSIWVFRGYMLRAAELYRDAFTARSMYGEVLVESTRAATMADDLQGGLSPEEQAAVAAFIREQGDAIVTSVRSLLVSGQITFGERSAMFNGVAYDILTGEQVRRRKWQWNAVAGRPLQKAGELVIGRELASLLGCTYNSGDYLNRLGEGPAYEPVERPFHCDTVDNKMLLNATTLSGQINAKYLTAVGLVDAGYRDIDRSWLMLSLEDGQALHNTKAISWWALSLRAPEDAALMAHRLNSYAAQRHLALSAQPWEEHRFTELYRRTMSLFAVFEKLVLTILTSVVGIAVFNLMVKVVQERRREIGLLRSLGYEAFDLYRLFLGESLLTATFGIAVGTGAAAVFTFAVNRAGIMYRGGIFSEPVPFSIALSPKLWLATAALLGAIALIASFLAIRRALHQEITECLAA